jgi:hypothetical protein
MANINLYRVSVPEGAYSKVDWIECEGYFGPTQYLQNSFKSIDFQAQNNSVSASAVATVSIIGYCLDDCTGCYLIGETTTTSTTIPPVDFTLTPTCEGTGVNGTGKITVNGFSGGNGTYTSVGIGNSAGSALSATPVALSGASTYSFTGVFNGTWHIILRDSSGASTTKSTAVNCTNTTTTTSTSTTSTTSTSTSTTSTTTAAINCTYNGGTAVMVYPTTTSTSTSTTAAPTSTSTSTSTTSTTTGAPAETTTSTTTTTTTGAPSATIQWDFEEMGGADGSMVLYVNGSAIETRYITSNGTYAVYEGDTINVEVSCNTCFSPNNCSTAESQSNKSVLVASDTVNSGAASIFTSVYTVVSGDMGNTINLSTFAICNSTCL